MGIQKKASKRFPALLSVPAASRPAFRYFELLTVYHFRGHDSLSLAVFNGIVLWGAADETGTGYCVPLAFELSLTSDHAAIYHP